MELEPELELWIMFDIWKNQPRMSTGKNVSGLRDMFAMLWLFFLLSSPNFGSCWSYLLPNCGTKHFPYLPTSNNGIIWYIPYPNSILNIFGHRNSWHISVSSGSWWAYLLPDCGTKLAFSLSAHFKHEFIHILNQGERCQLGVWRYCDGEWSLESISWAN